MSLRHHPLEDRHFLSLILLDELAHGLGHDVGLLELAVARVVPVAFVGEVLEGGDDEEQQEDRLSAVDQEILDIFAGSGDALWRSVPAVSAALRRNWRLFLGRMPEDLRGHASILGVLQDVM